MPTDFLEEMRFPKERNPPKQIDPSYWHDATFTFWFFQEGDKGRFGDSHTYPRHGSGLPDYCDIQVNRAEAISIWPDSSVAEDGPDWPIYELLWALKPNLDRDYRNPGPWKDTLREVRNMMRSRRTENGPPLLRAWGMPWSPDGPQELITPEFWLDSELSSQALDVEWWQIAVTTKTGQGVKKYRRVYVNKREALQVWPRLKSL